MSSNLRDVCIFLHYLIDDSKYARKVTALEKEVTAFLMSNFSRSLTCTPIDIENFFIFKDKGGKTQFMIHTVHILGVIREMLVHFQSICHLLQFSLY